MQCLSEQNVLKYNLFKAINDHREFQNITQNQNNNDKYGCSNNLKESIDIGSRNNLQNNHGYEEQGQSSRNKLQFQEYLLKKQINNQQNDQQLLPSSPKKKIVEINKQATKNAYCRLRQQNVKQQEIRQKQQNSQYSFNSTQNNQDIQLSYSRTLSSLKDLKFQDFGKTMVKKLIEKQTKKQSSTKLIEVNKERNEESVNYQQNSKGNDQNDMEADKKEQQASGNKALIEQNDIWSTLKTNDSVQEIPQRCFLDSNREHIQGDKLKIEANQDKQLRESLQERTFLKNKAFTIKNRNGSYVKMNENVNHNNNCLKTMGSNFMMRSSLYESQRGGGDDSQNISSQLALLSCKRKGAALKTRTLRQSQRSLRDLSPDNSIIPFKSNIQEQERDVQRQNDFITIQKDEKKSKLQNMQFYALPMNNKQSDQLYSSQFQYVRIPPSLSHLNSPNSTVKTKSITLQLQNNNKNNYYNNNINNNNNNQNNNQQNHTPGKISAKFRQAFKESIERHICRDQDQLMEIQKLFTDNSSTVLATKINKKEAQPFSVSTNESILKNNYNFTPQSYQKQYLLTQNNNIINSRQSSLEPFYDQNIQNSSLKKSENQINNFDQNSFRKLDANQVFENLPVHQQISELNYLHKMALNIQQTDSAKFIFSQSNFRRRNQLLSYKKIFKV